MWGVVERGRVEFASQSCERRPLTFIVDVVVVEIVHGGTTDDDLLWPKHSPPARSSGSLSLSLVWLLVASSSSKSTESLQSLASTSTYHSQSGRAGMAVSYWVACGMGWLLDKKKNQEEKCVRADFKKIVWGGKVCMRLPVGGSGSNDGEARGRTRRRHRRRRVGLTATGGGRRGRRRATRPHAPRPRRRPRGDAGGTPGRRAAPTPPGREAPPCS